jgi:phage baseplate assembly protein W
MALIFEPSIPLGTPHVWLEGDRALAARVRMVLETRPGQVPWRPTFGCDLAGLTGYPVTPELLAKAKSLIAGALTEWIKDAKLISVEVIARPLSSGLGFGGDRTVPLAEAAMMMLGAQAELEAVIEMLGPSGPVALTTAVSP